MGRGFEIYNFNAVRIDDRRLPGNPRNRSWIGRSKFPSE